MLRSSRCGSTYFYQDSRRLLLRVTVKPVSVIYVTRFHGAWVVTGGVDSCHIARRGRHVGGFGEFYSSPLRTASSTQKVLLGESSGHRTLKAQQICFLNVREQPDILLMHRTHCSVHNTSRMSVVR